MHLERLDISGIRNLEPTQLKFGRRLNFFIGENGSGKTSLLEAIYLLGRGRSFRTRHLSSVISNQSNDCLGSGQLVSSTGDTTQLGVYRQLQGGFHFRVNREPAHSASQLAAKLPLLLINSDSFSLLDGGPGNRRRYLDWLVFHVEQSSRALWKKLLHVLKQRNSLLRRGKIDPSELRFWDEEYCEVSGQVNQLRSTLFERLHPLIDQCMLALGGVAKTTYNYHPGWDVSKLMLDQLLAVREQEFRFKRTLIGPHQADIRIVIDGLPAKEMLSRGQSKVLVASMHLAQAKLLVNDTGETPVSLIDDLPAELDSRHQKLILKELLKLGGQVFVTGVDMNDLFMGVSDFVSENEVAVFHVKHGAIVNQKVGKQ